MSETAAVAADTPRSGTGPPDQGAAPQGRPAVAPDGEGGDELAFPNDDAPVLFLSAIGRHYQQG
jgi:hypothetical protein